MVIAESNTNQTFSGKEHNQEPFTELRMRPFPFQGGEFPAPSGPSRDYVLPPMEFTFSMPPELQYDDGFHLRREEIMSLPNGREELMSLLESII